RDGSLAYSSHATPFASRYARRSSAAGVSFPGGFVVSRRISRCRRSTASSRSVSVPVDCSDLPSSVPLPRVPGHVGGRFAGLLLLRQGGQLVARLPELRVELVLDQAAQQLDR